VIFIAEKQRLAENYILAHAGQGVAEVLREF